MDPKTRPRPELGSRLLEGYHIVASRGDAVTTDLVCLDAETDLDALIEADLACLLVPGEIVDLYHGDRFVGRVRG
jgi:hypothetical protein